MTGDETGTDDPGARNLAISIGTSSNRSSLGVRFEVVDWENYSTIGIGRPQALISQQTLERHRSSLALVVGLVGQRFESPTGEAESGTEEEFNWALDSFRKTGFPEIKWFFRRVDRFEAPPDPDKIQEALEQWSKVREFRSRIEDATPPGSATLDPGLDLVGFIITMVHLRCSPIVLRLRGTPPANPVCLGSRAVRRDQRRTCYHTIVRP